MNRLAALLALTACSSPAVSDVKRPPTGKPVSIALDQLCVTKGKVSAKLETGLPVDVPTMRLFAPSTVGESATLKFWFRGDTTDKTELASGKARRQLGVKLRAMNGCNLVYVMWRLDPKPKLEVSVKSNPGQVSHEQCGADGYVKVKASKTTPPPALRIGAEHTLRAEITGDALTAWIDDQIAWEGTLPEAARALVGPAGVRSDNLAFDLVELVAPSGPAGACKTELGD